MDSKTLKTCVLCKQNFTGFGNNPVPLAQKGLCCDKCNFLVIKERFKEYQNETDNSMNTPNNTPNNKMYAKPKTSQTFTTSELSAQNQHETSVYVDI